MQSISHTIYDQQVADSGNELSENTRKRVVLIRKTLQENSVRTLREQLEKQVITNCY